MSGSNDTTGRSAGDALDLLGRMTADPAGAFEEVAAHPRVGSGLIVMALAVAGRALADPLPWDDGPLVLLRRFGSTVAGSLVLWFLLASLGHGLSRLAGKKGRFDSFLAVAGWAGVALWGELPFRLLASAAPDVALLASPPRLLFRCAAYALWWWGLQRVYGWSRVGALLLMLLPALAVGTLVFALGLAAALFFTGSAAFFHSLVH